MKITVDTTNLITAIVALYGAVLSTYTLINQHKDKKSRLKVQLHLGFIGDSINGLGENLIFIHGANIGRIPVTVSGHSFRLPDKNQLVIAMPGSDVKFPHELLAGKSCQIWMEVASLSESLKNRGYSGVIKIRGEFKDQTGKIYRSKPFKLDIESWLKQ